MIQAIEQRRQTMLKVMNYIVERQRDFFEKGVQYLKPLTLREVAEVISMHESTVSRVTNEKFVQTPRGVLPLKFFFSSGLSTTGGEDVSARGIKDQIQKLVENEDPKHPLTDQAIVNILKESGVQIARRTVAKYRDQLGVLSARMRKASLTRARWELRRQWEREQGTGNEVESPDSRFPSSRIRYASPVPGCLGSRPAKDEIRKPARVSCGRRPAAFASSDVRYEVIVIDDGSEDDTWDVLQSARHAIPVPAAAHAIALGAGSPTALRTGTYSRRARGRCSSSTRRPAVQAGRHSAASSAPILAGESDMVTGIQTGAVREEVRVAASTNGSVARCSTCR
jgi:hypothetical protein